MRPIRLRSWVWLSTLFLISLISAANPADYKLEKIGILSGPSDPILVTRFTGNGQSIIYGFHDTAADVYRIFLRSLELSADPVELARIHSSNGTRNVTNSVANGYNPDTGQLVFASDENGDGLDEVYLTNVNNPEVVTKIQDYDHLELADSDDQRIDFNWVDNGGLLLRTFFGASSRIYFIDLYTAFDPVTSERLVDGLQTLGAGFGKSELFFKYSLESQTSMNGGNLFRSVLATGESATVISGKTVNAMRTAVLQSFTSGRSMVFMPDELWKFSLDGNINGTNLEFPDSIQLDNQLLAIDFPNEVIYPHGIDFVEQSQAVFKIDIKSDLLSIEPLFYPDYMPRDAVVSRDGSVLAHHTIPPEVSPVIWQVDTETGIQQQVPILLDVPYTAVRGPRGFSNDRAMIFQLENAAANKAWIYYRNWDDSQSPVLFAEFPLSDYRGTARLSHFKNHTHLHLRGTSPSIPDRLFIANVKENIPGIEVTFFGSLGKNVLPPLNPHGYDGLVVVVDDPDTASANMDEIYWVDFKEPENPVLLAAPTNGLVLENYTARPDGNAFAFTATNALDEGYILYYLKVDDVQWQWTDAARISPDSDWYRSDWFGLFYRKPGGRYLYSPNLGWLYYQSDSASNIWLYHYTLGWLWTQSTIFPYLFSANTGNWYYYHPSVSAGAYFYDFSIGSWIHI